MSSTIGALTRGLPALPGTAISDDVKVRDVASLRKAPELIDRFGDASVGALRDLFGGLRISDIAMLPKAARAVLLSMSAGVEGTRTPATLAAAAGLGLESTNRASVAEWLEGGLAHRIKGALARSHVSGGNDLKDSWAWAGAELANEAKAAAYKLRHASGSGAKIEARALAIREIFEQKVEAWLGRADAPSFEIPSDLELPKAASVAERTFEADLLGRMKDASAAHHRSGGNDLQSAWSWEGANLANEVKARLASVKNAPRAEQLAVRRELEARVSAWIARAGQAEKSVEKPAAKPAEGRPTGAPAKPASAKGFETALLRRMKDATQAHHRSGGNDLNDAWVWEGAKLAGEVKGAEKRAPADRAALEARVDDWIARRGATRGEGKAEVKAEAPATKTETPAEAPVPAKAFADGLIHRMKEASAAHHRSGGNDMKSAWSWEGAKLANELKDAASLTGAERDALEARVNDWIARDGAKRPTRNGLVYLKSPGPISREG